MPTLTSESVAAGHPDKIADQISDAIVDAALSIDPHSRIAVETLVTKDQIILAGEVRCPGKLPFKTIARRVVKSLGYTNGITNFSHRSPIQTFIQHQSPDIAQGVDTGGAGDQGMMYGYATSETSQFLPLPIAFSHQVVSALDQARVSGALPYLRPDGKAAVTIEYNKGKPHRVTTIIIAVPHEPQISNQELTSDLRHYVIIPTLSKFNIHYSKFKLIVNGTGSWPVGGPAFDTGLTGRKIIVDTYGGLARHGGGAFSGKDPTKVDRSGAYATRYLAKNIVAAGLADRCEVSVAYVIGQPRPVAVNIDTFGTGHKSDRIISSFATDLLDLSVPNILEKLDLRRPIYADTARYGHFGRDQFPWEQISKH